MNAHPLRRVPLVRWPVTPCRRASSKVPRDQIPISKRKQPLGNTQNGPSELKRTVKPKRREVPPKTQSSQTEDPSSETKEKKSKHGIPPTALAFMGITALAISTYSSYLYASYKREVNKSQALVVSNDVSDRYNKTASTFDADVEISEKFMQLGSKRNDLIRHARGNVLEVSCGTGRNLPYYLLGERRGVNEFHHHLEVNGCRSITFTDLSPQMVAITKQKFESMYPEFTRVSFQCVDAGSVTPPPAGPGDPPRYFDTIVQTMGLCSMPDPVATLRHLGSITEPKNGHILLLEHGRSRWDWVNGILDNLAPAHADRHGCWWNRDIGAIVRESGLVIVEEKRWHFGTTYRYVLRPPGSSE
ncbi:hypothetical protein N7467_007473 [Penicillium canescens]|nr:hypothetical protein N7467_007473 [Penicillium canescens]